MGWNTFTPEEIAELKQNPYVKSINIHKISLTVSFKIDFWERYEKGELPTAIIRSMGIDTESFGETRIRGIVQHIKDQAESGSGFREGYNFQDKNAPADQSKPVSKRLLRLEHELTYTRQELEFIKKNILADRKASRKCLSNQERMSNSKSSEK